MFLLSIRTIIHSEYILINILQYILNTKDIIYEVTLQCIKLFLNISMNNKFC